MNSVTVDEVIDQSRNCTIVVWSNNTAAHINERGKLTHWQFPQVTPPNVWTALDRGMRYAGAIPSMLTTDQINQAYALRAQSRSTGL